MQSFEYGKTSELTMMRFTADDVGLHREKPGKYLIHLRENGDYRSCDIDLKLRDGTERIHSVVAGSHSPKIAKLIASSQLPLDIDMRRFRSSSVERVIDWMYKGEVELPLEHLSDLLAVTHFLGVLFLHRLLEKTLKSMCLHPNQRVVAFNIASNPNAGVSPETSSLIVSLLQENYGQWSSKEISKLQLCSILALVSGPTSKAGKTDIINLALQWLRFADHLKYVEEVIPKIEVAELNKKQLKELQKTLMIAMCSSATRQFVSVSLDRSGDLNVHMSRHVSSDISSNPSKNASDTSMAAPGLPTGGKADKDRSYDSLIREMDCLPDCFRKTASEEEFASLKKSTSRSDFEKDAYRNAKNDFVHKKTDRRAEVTPSLIFELNNLPADMFTKSPNLRKMKRSEMSPSEIQHIQNLPVSFDSSTSINKQRKLSRTKSEIMEMTALPDIFVEKEDVRRYRTQSEMEEINRIPVSFDKSNTCQMPALRSPFNQPNIRSSRSSLCPTAIEGSVDFNGNRCARPVFKAPDFIISKNEEDSDSDKTNSSNEASRLNSETQVRTRGKYNITDREAADIKELPTIADDKGNANQNNERKVGSRNSQYASAYKGSDFVPSYYAFNFK